MKNFRNLLILLTLLSPLTASAELISHWSFDETAGSLKSTDSVSSVDASAYAGGSKITSTTSKVTFGGDGAFGTSVKLNGGYMQLTGSYLGTTYDCLYSGDFTVSYWVNADSLNTSTWTPFFGDWNNPWAFQSIYTDGNVQNMLRIPADNKDGFATITTSTSKTLELGTWHMITSTLERATGTAKLYIDGNLSNTVIDSRLKTSNLMSYTALQFGVKGDSGGSVTFKGSMDEAYIFNEALPSYQIQSLYKSNELRTEKFQEINLGNLINSTVADALGDAQTNVRNYNASQSPAIVKAGPFTISDASNVKINLLSSSENGIFLDMTGQSQLHCNRNGANGTVKLNQCGNDSTSGVSLPDGVTLQNYISMHANGMITYDLNEIRSALNLGTAVYDFSTIATVAHDADGAVYSLAILSSDEEGVLHAYLQGEEIGFTENVDGSFVLDIPEASKMPAYITKKNAVNVNFEVMPDADYLTLFTFTGTDPNSDHAAYANSILTFAYSVPEPATWVMLVLGVVFYSEGRRPRRPRTSRPL